ncbi:hypothetical protein D3C72_2533200 [compost metagenome]
MHKFHGVRCFIVENSFKYTFSFFDRNQNEWAIWSSWYDTIDGKQIIGKLFDFFGIQVIRK